MKKKLLLQTLVLLTFIFSAQIFSQNLDSNLTVQGKWTIGTCDAVFVEGNYAFISSGRGMRIMDVTNPDYPVQVSQVYTGSVVNDIFVQNNLVFLATGDFHNIQAGLTIVDISDVTKPQILSIFNTENVGATCVAAEGNFAYVGYINSLIILDISNPSEPQSIKHFSLSRTPHDVFIDNNKLYIADQLGGTIIMDVTAPASSPIIATIDLWSEKVFVQDNLVFITQQGEGLKIVDIQNIDNPSVVASVASTNEFDYGVFVEGNNVYVSGFGDSLNTSSSMLKIIDITQITDPAVLGTYYTDNIGTNYLESGKSIFKSGNFIYMATDKGLRIIDITNLGNPILRSNYRTIDDESKVSVIGDYAYLASAGLVLSIVDIANPNYLKETGYVNLTRDDYSGFIDMSVNNGYAYVAQHSLTNSDSDGVSIVDISNPVLPVEKSYYHIDRVEKLTAWDNYLYTYGHDDTLRIIDASDPEFPFEVNKYYFRDWTPGYITGIKADNNYLYISTGNGFLILNKQNPTDLGLAGLFETSNNNIAPLGNFNINNNYAYLTSDEGILVLDISNPASPDSVSVFSIGAQRNDITTCGNYAYVATDAGIFMLDISDKTSPHQVGFFSNSGYSRAVSIACSNNKIYTAFEGLIVLSNDFTTDVKENKTIISNSFSLSQNYPNPFNPSTTIEYSIPAVGDEYIRPTNNVTLKIYDILGEEITTLVNKKQTPGNYDVKFNAGNLSSGIYFYRLKAGNFSKTNKMILLK